MIPLLDLKPQYQSLQSGLDQAVQRVMESGYYILGPEVRALEQEIAEYCGVKHAIGVASGTDALILSLMALDIKPGDEVITTPYSFFATVSSITRTGGIPRFVDIDPLTFNLDVSQLAAAVTDRTKAIMPVHLFGQTAEMDPVNAVARAHGLAVIEDAAQALGARYNDRPAGAMGLMGCFSFFPSKNLGGAGDGGMVTTSDDGVAARLRRLRVHGASTTYFHEEVGLNSRLDELQAAILRVKLPHLDNWSEQRRANAALYREWFHGTSVIAPEERPGTYCIYNQFVVRIGPRRDDLAAELKRQSIGHSVYYPVPLHLQPCFAQYGGAPGQYPEAELAARETIALPIFPGLTPDQIETVAKAVVQFTDPA